jgi:hypothetical protein
MATFTGKRPDNSSFFFLTNAYGAINPRTGVVTLEVGRQMKKV